MSLKSDKIAFLIVGGILSLALLAVLAGGIKSLIPSKAEAATSTVGVTATIEAWLSLSLSTTSVSLSPALVDSAGGTHIGSSTPITLSVGTNNGNGWTTSIKGANAGLYSSTNSYLISTVSATSTLTAGTDGYGANATPTLSGVTIGNYYDFYGSDTVGEIASSTTNTLCSKNSANTTQSVCEMKVKAAAQATTPAGTDYQDTITITATPQT